MIRLAQPQLSEDDQYAMSQYIQRHQHLENLSFVTIHSDLSDLRQFVAWCECSWRDVPGDRFFILPQAIAPALLICYREYLQTTLNLKPSTVNRSLMSLQRYFSWTRKMHLIRSNPANPIKFVPKESALPRHLSDEEKEALVAAVNANRIAEMILLHRLAQIMGYASLDTTMLSIRGTKQGLQQNVEKIAWI